MTSKQLVLAMLGVSLTAGCVYVPLGKVPKLAAGTTAAAGTAVLQVTPKVLAGGYTVQQVVNVYSKEDVNHLLVVLFKLDGASESAMVDTKGDPIYKDVARGNLETPLTFSNLHPNTTYRLKSFAFQAAGTASVDIISTEASATVDVRVGADNKPTSADLPVQLKDKDFAGRVDPTLGITPGIYQTLPEGIE